MIQKILDVVSKLTGSYTDIVEAEKILKILLAFMVIDEIFEMERKDDGIIIKQDASVFLGYLNDQLNLYVEDKDVKLFLFSTLSLMYFMDAKRIMDRKEMQMLLSEDSKLLYNAVRANMRPMLVEELRRTELFFKGVENEKV